MHFVQIEFRSLLFLLLHILSVHTRHAAQPIKQKQAPEVPIDVPLKALIKFSQSNQIILKSFLLFFPPGLVSESSRQVSEARALSAAESIQLELCQRLNNSCEEWE